MYKYYQSLLNIIPESFKNERHGLLLLFLLALFLRSLFVIIVYSIQGTERFSDALGYLSSGQQIASGNLNPPWSTKHDFLFVAPWVPIMVAFCYKLFGTAIIPMFVYNIVLGSLTVPVVYYLGKELFSKKVGWLFAIWAVLYFSSFRYYPVVLKEVTLLLMFPLSLLLLIRSIKNNYSFKSLVLGALAFAVLIHTDERFVVYFPVLALLFLFAPGKPFLSRIKPMMAWVAIVLLLMVPWSIRNYKVFGQVVIIAPRTTVFTSKLWGEAIMAQNLLDESRAESEARSRAEGVRALTEQYGIEPKTRTKREAQMMAFIHFWQPTFFKPTFIQYGHRPVDLSWRRNTLFILSYGIFLPFYVLGLFLLYQRKLFMVLFLATIPIIHSLLHTYMIWPLTRYRFPVEFVVAMVGIWCMVEINRYYIRRNAD